MDRQYRLTASRQFQAVRQRGRSWSHRMAVMAAAPNGLAVTRCGFTTARQITTAVARNRARRLFREALRRLHPRIPAGWDLVFIARQPMAGADYWAVSAAVEALLRQGRLLTDASG